MDFGVISRNPRPVLNLSQIWLIFWNFRFRVFWLKIGHFGDFEEKIRLNLVKMALELSRSLGSWRDSADPDPWRILHRL